MPHTICEILNWRRFTFGQSIYVCMLIFEVYCKSTFTEALDSFLGTIPQHSRGSSFTTSCSLVFLRMRQNLTNCGVGICIIVHTLAWVLNINNFAALFFGNKSLFHV